MKDNVIAWPKRGRSPAEPRPEESTVILQRARRELAEVQRNNAALQEQLLQLQRERELSQLEQSLRRVRRTWEVCLFLFLLYVMIHG